MYSIYKYTHINMHANMCVYDRIHYYLNIYTCMYTNTIYYIYTVYIQSCYMYTLYRMCAHYIGTYSYIHVHIHIHICHIYSYIYILPHNYLLTIPTIVKSWQEESPVAGWQEQRRSGSCRMIMRGKGMLVVCTPLDLFQAKRT